MLYWGSALAPSGDSPSPAELVSLADAQAAGIPPSSIGGRLPLTLLPLQSEGWSGQPALSVQRSSGTVAPTLTRVSIEQSDPHSVTIGVVDEECGVAATISLALTPEGLLVCQNDVTNTGSDPLTVHALRVTLPLPDSAGEILDFSGRWAHERRPQRRRLDHGTWSRQNRHGRTGHDSPILMAAGSTGFGFRHGRVWGIHLAFSGDQELGVESHPTGHKLVGAGELLQPGEIVLEPGATYSTPTVYGAYSARGLDAVSEQFHAQVRRLGTLASHPVILNTWEAVYFDHQLARLVQLAELGASVGVERFVLDDGWMVGRTDATRALGDWRVDPDRWPDGLDPLIERVTALGMEFGLWVEPEMVSLDSDLAREHPDWVLRDSAGRLPEPWRDQYVLDLGNSDAWQNIFGQLSALLDEYPISYLKWDQNRDMLQGSSHVQTNATYRLMDALRHRYPGLEIESCSSGGGRIDLGVLRHTDRVWASDTNDPLERQAIQRYTSLVLPPEVIGSHLGAATAHTTGRTTDLGFRLATAFFWWAGIEWDLTKASAAELQIVRDWVAQYKTHRPLLHSGVTVRCDPTDPAVHIHGVVSRDQGEAIFAIVFETAPMSAPAGSARFPGLDPDRSYRLEALPVGGVVNQIADEPPAWLSGGTTVLTGLMLSEAGVALPLLAVQQALMVRLVAV